MTLTLYMDHNVVRAVTEGCRLNGLDVLTALDDGWHQEKQGTIAKQINDLSESVNLFSPPQEFREMDVGIVDGTAELIREAGGNSVCGAAFRELPNDLQP